MELKRQADSQLNAYRLFVRLKPAVFSLTPLLAYV